MLVDQISLISSKKDLSAHQNKRSNFLKCSSISICDMFCFANINIRADASTIYFWNNLNIPTSSATLSYERLFSEGTLFPWGENGEDMLHHKNQGTDNPMFCWKFLHDSYIKTESAHWEKRYFPKWILTRHSEVWEVHGFWTIVQNILFVDFYYLWHNNVQGGH